MDGFLCTLFYNQPEVARKSGWLGWKIKFQTNFTQGNFSSLWKAYLRLIRLFSNLCIYVRKDKRELVWLECYVNSILWSFLYILPLKRGKTGKMNSTNTTNSCSFCRRTVFTCNTLYIKQFFHANIQHQPKVY